MIRKGENEKIKNKMSMYPCYQYLKNNCVGYKNKPRTNNEWDADFNRENIFSHDLIQYLPLILPSVPYILTTLNQTCFIVCRSVKL